MRRRPYVWVSLGLLRGSGVGVAPTWTSRLQWRWPMHLNEHLPASQERGGGLLRGILMGALLYKGANMQMLAAACYTPHSFLKSQYSNIAYSPPVACTPRPVPVPSPPSPHLPLFSCFSSRISNSATPAQTTGVKSTRLSLLLLSLLSLTHTQVTDQVTGRRLPRAWRRRRP